MYIVERSVAGLPGDWYFIWSNNMVVKLICFVYKKILIFRHISRLFSVQNIVLEGCWIMGTGSIACCRIYKLSAPVTDGLQVEAIYFLAWEVSLVIVLGFALQRDLRTVEEPKAAWECHLPIVEVSIKGSICTFGDNFAGRWQGLLQGYFSVEWSSVNRQSVKALDWCLYWRS